MGNSPSSLTSCLLCSYALWTWLLTTRIPAGDGSPTPWGLSTMQPCPPPGRLSTPTLAFRSRSPQFETPVVPDSLALSSITSGTFPYFRNVNKSFFHKKKLYCSLKVKEKEKQFYIKKKFKLEKKKTQEREHVSSYTTLRIPTPESAASQSPNSENHTQRTTKSCC